MPRVVVRALRLEDSAGLTENYNALREVLYKKNFDVLKCDKIIYQLKESELVYLYWELVHTKVSAVNVKTNVYVMKQKLLKNFMDRKYKRGRYGKKNKNS